MLAAFAALRFPLDEIEVFHTDRGGGFAGERVERVLDVFGVTRSLSRPGNPYDNAVVESTCVCSIESGPCERVESLQMSGRF